MLFFLCLLLNLLPEGDIIKSNKDCLHIVTVIDFFVSFILSLQQLFNEP